MRSVERQNMIENAKAVVRSEGPNQDFFIRIFDIVRERYSIRQLAMKLGIASSGHMAAIIGGEKFLGSEALYKLSELLKFNQQEEKLLILCKEILKTRMSEEKSKLIAEFLSVQKSAQVRTVKINPVGGLLPVIIDVFAVLGMLRDPAGTDTIQEYLPHYTSFKIERAYGALKELGAIEVQSDNRIKLINQEIDFRPLTSTMDMQDVVKFFIQEAMAKASIYAIKRHESCFESAAITIKSRDLQSISEKLRSTVGDVYSQLEDAEGDSIIRVNLQMYPISKKVSL
jgi:uncharacterized protein (TIGR02147 family)